MSAPADIEADPTTEISSTLLHMAGVHGRCDDRFAAIKALAEELAVEDDDGFALAVEVDGELVVDLWVGRTSEASLIHTFSTVKPLTACSLLLLVECGEISLSTTLGTIWPELSTQVAACTIADALGHRCGLIEVPNGSIEGLLDWDASIAAIAASEPLWTPGAAHGEHAFTYGHLIGELLRRITGQSIGSFIRSEISEAHDIDAHIGLGFEELGRVTDISTDLDFWSSIGWTSREAVAALGADPGIGADVVNSTRWRTGEVPAVNGHASARGLARFWSLVLDGTLPASMMEVAGTGHDLVIGEQITWTLGSAQLDPGHGGIGMGGLGGSFAGAIPEHGVTWSFLPVRMGDFTRVESIESSLLRQITG
jgi:CubicO group peptidase (beta-lactamase class C family)